VTELPSNRRIKTSAWKHAGEALILLAFCLFGCLMGQALSALHSQGVFAQWRPLGTPPGEEIHIVGALTDRTTKQVDVFVQSGSGKIYRRSTDTDGGWLEATLPAKKIGDLESVTGGSERGNWHLGECSLAGRESIRPNGVFDINHRISVSLRSEVQDCAATIWAWEWGADEVTYTLILQDNSVWQWYENFANFVPYAFCAAPILGFFLGIGVLLFIKRRRQLRKT
jgi:hypothetical protein